ncbi:hypothetical protein FOCC_FOCC015551 [Frankliniella occidentalis]|nr:hypothetical protein FOCC_FOCC015551 [Frankliniella occidentalis]
MSGKSKMLWTLTLVVALALLQPPVASANNRLADLMENMAELSKCVEAKPRYHVKTSETLGLSPTLPRNVSGKAVHP